MKDQLAAAQSRLPTLTDTESSARSIASTAPSSTSEDNLLNIPTPSTLCLSDLSIAPARESPTKDIHMHTPKFATPRPIRSSSILGVSPSPLLHKSHYRSAHLATPPTSSSPSLARSSTLPSLLTPSRLPPRTPVPRPAVIRNVSNLSSTATSTSSGVTATASRSKGVQMVSEMRARVRVLEQKIHTRVPRLRMGSTTSRTIAIPPPPPPPKAGPSSVSVSPSPSTSSTRSVSNDERSSQPKLRRPSFDSESNRKRVSGGDSSGWVLIMDDSPSPTKDKDKERRRTSQSSPTAPSAFRPPPTPHESPSPTGIPRAPSSLSHSTMPSGIRRPQSRVSEGRSSVSTNATTSTVSSIPTPSSRPTTPTYLPLPTYGGQGLKLSTVQGSGHSGQYQLKRSSLGVPVKSPMASSPQLHSHITVRPLTKSIVGNPMAQSRIGKPATHSGGRRSVGEVSDNEMLTVRDLSRARSGSTAASYGKRGGV